MVRNTPSPTSTDIASQLQAERDALHAFVTLLETEQQALIAGQAEQLLALADSKTRAVHALNNLASARKNTLLAHGANNDSGGVEAWLQAHAPDSLPVWHDIQNLAAHTQQKNRSNGELIQARLKHNQQALTVLRNAVNSASGLYGPDGQPHLPTSGRTLGSG
ncbi:hypothetical protein RHDC2_00192 [Rhodocyclaceae bacterium]|nr:hypothetical protein RHDC2_00192 [Rhodocyclaceae bacterium]